MSGHVGDLLSPFLDEELSRGERLRVETHLAECDACARHLEELVFIDTSVREAPAAAPPGYFDTLPASIRARALPAPARRRLGWLSSSWTWAAAAALLVAVLAPLTLQEERARMDPDETRLASRPAPAAAEEPEGWTGNGLDRPPAVPATTPARPAAQEGHGGVAPANPKPGTVAPTGTKAGTGAPASREARLDARTLGVATSADTSEERTTDDRAAVRATAARARPSGHTKISAAPASKRAVQPRFEPEAAKTMTALQEADVRATPSASPSGFARVPIEDAASRPEEDAKVLGYRAPDKRPRESSPARRSTAVAESAVPPAQPSSDATIDGFRVLLKRQAQTAVQARQLRKAWRSYAAAHPDTVRGDEARVRVIETGALAWQLGHDPADRRLAERDGRAYLERPGNHVERVQRILRDLDHQ